MLFEAGIGIAQGEVDVAATRVRAPELGDKAVFGCRRFRSIQRGKRLVVAIEHPQGGGQGEPEVDLATGPLDGLRQGLEGVEALGEMTDRLDIGRARDRSLSRPPPVGDRRFRHSRLGEMMGEKLGFVSGDLGEAILERRGDAGVQPLAAAAQ